MEAMVGQSRFGLWLAATVAALSLLGPAAAQDFPARPLKIVMGFGAGGLGDIAARALGQEIGRAHV